MDTIEYAIEQFKKDINQNELIFSNKTNEERKMIHTLCATCELYSESYGPTVDRKLIVTKTSRKESTEINITDTDRKLFIKDYSLPIPVHMEPYFSYYMNLFDPLYNTKDKYKLLIDAKTILNKQQTTLKDESYRIMNAIIIEVKRNPLYNELIKETKYDLKVLPNDVNIYGKNKKFYISLDIIKANFTSAKFISPELVLKCNTWEDFMRKFTPLEYFIQSKYFRQIVYGNLGIKKILSVQKYMLAELYDKIKDHVQISGKCASDELFIATTENDMIDDYQKIMLLVNDLPENMKHIWRIAPISVEPLGTSNGHIRKTFNNLNNLDDFKIEIRNVNKDFYAQAYKYYIGEEITDSDMMAMKDEYLIKYCATAFFIDK